MTAFKLREIDDKSSNTDFKSIFNHITKEYNEVADIKQMNIQTETKENKSILDNLKYSNITNIFYNFKMFIHEQIGPDFTSFLQHFQADSIVSNTATVLTLIVAPSAIDPTPHVHMLITMRCRHENFDAISLSNDLEAIRNVRKI